MNHTSYRLSLPLLLVVALMSLAWVTPEPLIPYQIYNERGEVFQIDPVRASESFTFELTAEMSATLSVYDSHGSLMARRLLDPELDRTRTEVDVRRWARGRYDMTVETKESTQQVPLTVE